MGIVCLRDLTPMNLIEMELQVFKFRNNVISHCCGQCYTIAVFRPNGTGWPHAPPQTFPRSDNSSSTLTISATALLLGVRELEGSPGGTKSMVEFNKSWQSMTKQKQKKTTEAERNGLSLKEAKFNIIWWQKKTTEAEWNKVFILYYLMIPIFAPS